MLMRHLIVVKKAEESLIATAIKMGEILALKEVLVLVLLKQIMEESHAMNGETALEMMEAW
jgi:hypothetical protein